MSSDHDLLLSLLAELSFRRGHFVLSSGATSPFYVDARKTTMSPQGLVLTGRLGLELIRKEFENADAVGGLTLGADPVAYAISYASAATSRPLRAFTVRKEAKAHGTRQQIEGPFKPGDRCIIIEDVITTGSSALNAIAAVRNAGGIVEGVLAVLDRQEDGTRTIATTAGVPVRCLTLLEELADLVPAPGSP
jgi:orotate phosphoribosyltransferase